MGITVLLVQSDVVHQVLVRIRTTLKHKLDPNCVAFAFSLLLLCIQC
jgi:hypothetical protein